jgi:hypothetical protein
MRSIAVRAPLSVIISSSPFYSMSPARPMRDRPRSVKSVKSVIFHLRHFLGEWRMANANPFRPSLRLGFSCG